MEKELYNLTDGIEIFDTRYMTIEEYENEQRNANEASDGQVYWSVYEDF